LARVQAASSWAVVALHIAGILLAVILTPACM
jgi:hypothetical protein